MLLTITHASTNHMYTSYYIARAAQVQAYIVYRLEGVEPHAWKKLPFESM